MTRPSAPAMLQILGIDDYKGLTSWFKTYDDVRTPAKAVMAIFNELESIDEKSGENHMIDTKMEIAREIVTTVTGQTYLQTEAPVPLIVTYIVHNAQQVLIKWMELNRDKQTTITTNA